MSKAAMAGILAGLQPAVEGDDRLRAAAGMALDAASEGEDEGSYSRQDVIRAADFVAKIYGDEAIAHAERYAPPGKQMFARLVLRELRDRAAK